MNRFSIRTLASFVVVLALPVVALAADDGEKVEAIASVKQGVYSAVTALVVFGIVFAVLATKVWPTITKALDERAAKIAGEIDAAEAARAQAKMALEQYERNLADARAEAQKMLENAKVQQLAQTAALKAQADKELGEMKDKAMREIDAAKKVALGEIHSQAADLASLAAAKILRREINRGDQQRMVDECLAEMKA
ncbi:MAG: F0F1 ATP synthase subunit B [Phycisphaerales bacterium]